MSNLTRIKTFAINVKSNDFRRQHILSQIEKAGLDITIFDAVTPDTLDRESHCYNEQKTRYFTGRPLMPGEMACALSHISLWRQLENDRDADFYVIFEDDIHITQNIGQIIENLDLEKLDLVKFSGQQDRPMKKVKDLSSDSVLYHYAFGPLDSAAYLISTKAAKILSRYCETLHTPIDILMDRSYEHGVPIYGVLPYAANTKFNFDKYDPLFTDIGIRDRKYSDDITPFEKMMVKFNRLKGSVKRHIATLRLYITKENYA